MMGCKADSKGVRAQHGVNIMTPVNINKSKFSIWNWVAIFCASLSSLSTERSAARVLSSPLVFCISRVLSSSLRSSSSPVTSFNKSTVAV